MFPRIFNPLHCFFTGLKCVQTGSKADTDDGLLSESQQDSTNAATEEELIRRATADEERESRIRRLEADLTVMSGLASESQSTLSSTQDSLIQVTEEIASLYHLVCEVNGETPNRLTLEHVRQDDKHIDRLKARVRSSHGDRTRMEAVEKCPPVDSLTDTLTSGIETSDEGRSTESSNMNVVEEPQMDISTEASPGGGSTKQGTLAPEGVSTIEPVEEVSIIIVTSSNS